MGGPSLQVIDFKSFGFGERVILRSESVPEFDYVQTLLSVAEWFVGASVALLIQRLRQWGASSRWSSEDGLRLYTTCGIRTK